MIGALLDYVAEWIPDEADALPSTIDAFDELPGSIANIAKFAMIEVSLSNNVTS